MTGTPPPIDQRQPEADPSSTSASGTRANVDRATVIAEDLIDRGAPWSPRTSWVIVLVEGVVAAIVGLLFLIEPLGGSGTTLVLIGLILLGGALVTSFQLWRHHIRPDLEQLMAFRAGSGVTVGSLVVVASVLTEVTGTVTASLAVAVGIGFIVFGLTGIGASFVRRASETPLPLPSLVINAVMALAGLVLLFAGTGGSGAVDSIFNVLGVLLVAAGLALAGYAYMLRQQEAGNR